MRWSWKIGRILGIDVYVHALFLLLLGFVGLSNWLSSGSLAQAVDGVLYILALFACVLLHEFGHSLAARQFDIPTRDITLLPIGGVARLERMPEKPLQELWVAIAGPLVNVVIAAGLGAWLLVTSALTAFSPLGLGEGSFAQRLLSVNVSLVLFNLIPAFPMDGGRVLRALLATRLDYVRATQIAALLGQGLALVFGFVGFFGNLFLVVIAVFVWIGAGQEASMVQMKSALGGIPVRRAMLTDFRALAPGDPLARAIELIMSGSQQDFPVVEADRVVGVLARDDLLAALSQKPPTTPVAEVMQTDFIEADSYEMLETAFARLQAHACHTMPITHGGRLVGLLTMENVGEFLMIQSALEAAGRFRPQGA